MVERMMVFSLGFLIAAAFFLLFTPLVHNRAVRLTMRRLREAMPVTMSEIGVQRDHQRAEFALAIRRLEVAADELRAKTMTQLAELGKKTKTINQLREEVAQGAAAVSLLEAREKSLLEQIRLSERRLELALLPTSFSRDHTLAE